jgi:hypothetical protein
MLHYPARPAPATTWEQTYPATPDQARRLRAALGTLLARCPLADDVILLASELAANAITHSASSRPGGTFTSRLAHHPGDHIHAEVTDQGSSWDGDLTATAGSPHGLHLLHALATRCGTTASAGSRTVWFRLDYPRLPARPGTRSPRPDRQSPPGRIPMPPAPPDPAAMTPAELNRYRRDLDQALRGLPGEAPARRETEQQLAQVIAEQQARAAAAARGPA